MRIPVKLFAAARQELARDTVLVDLPDRATVGDLRQALVAQYPHLAVWKDHLLFAIECEYAADEARIAPNAEVACFPPVSGG